MATIDIRREQYSEVVEKNCVNLEVDPKLMKAIIEVESAWHPYAIRYEPSCTYTTSPGIYADANLITVHTERALQMFSWGLGQIMGYNARAFGFRGPMQSLCEADCGSFWAVMYLKKLVIKYDNMEDQIAAYNAGNVKKLTNGLYSNQAYVDKVAKVLQL